MLQLYYTIKNVKGMITQVLSAPYEIPLHHLLVRRTDMIGYCVSYHSIFRKITTNRLISDQNKSKIDIRKNALS